MKYDIEGKLYNVEVVYKNNKNTYVRIKDDLTIYVTTNYFVSLNKIKKILDDNYDYLKKGIEKIEGKALKEDEVYLLGKKYKIVIKDVKGVYIEGDFIYTKDLNTYNKWLKKEILTLYKSHLDKIYNEFEENIPYPKLKIRNMKTRWGVNNKRDNSVTLNTKLITFDLTKLDYVIVHELSHFIHFNHSKEFWNVVEKYYPNYKRIRKEMKE